MSETHGAADGAPNGATDGATNAAHAPRPASHRPGARGRARAREAGPADGTPAALSLVIDELLHDGGVYVFRGHAAGGAPVRCVARRQDMRAPAPGETWAVEGAWQSHPVHGRQVGVTGALLQRPSGRLFVQAVARNAGAFPGIGVARAQHVWDAHGAGIFDLLDAGDPAPFAAALGADLADVLVDGWRAIDVEARAYRWLTHYGFAPRLAARVVAIYQAVPVPEAHRAAAARQGAVVWHLEDDPYRMLSFASWRQTEAAARQLGVPEDDDRRLVGAVEATCADRLARGDTWVGGDALSEAAARLLGLPRAAGERAVGLAAERRAVVPHAGGYQPPGAWAMERYVDDRLCAMRDGRDAPAQRRLEYACTRPDVEAVLGRFDVRQGYPLTAEQRDAVWMAVTEPVSALLGGPGVGKTTVLRAVHAVCDAYPRAVYQAALSGRAAQRMKEATGRHADTIAALLVRIERGGVGLDDEPLLVLDEGSMVDLGSLYRLLARLPPGVRLLMVGDPGQLAPVSFGLTFHVLAADDRVPRTTLTVPQRATEASGIPVVCRDVRAGVVPALAAPDWSRPAGVSFVRASPDDVTRTVLDVLQRLGGLRAARVVGSGRARPGGVAEINRTLQGLRAVGRPQLRGRFYADDPVVATANDYELAVMNGELGAVLGDAEGGALRVRFDSGVKDVPASSLDDLDLAYAITTHKAQGSQFGRVIVPITPSRIMDRTLLLTAISRAQHQVVLVGDPDVFARAVAAEPASARRQVGLGR